MTRMTDSSAARVDGSDAPGDIPVTLRVRPIAIALVVIAAGLATAHLAVHTLATLQVLTYDGRIVRAFDMDAEASIPTWFNMMLLVGIAVLLGATAIATEKGHARRWWWLLAVAFAYLSLDEGSALHESLMYVTRNALGITGGPLWYAWVIPVGLALVIAAPFAVRFVWSLPISTRRLIIVAALLYIGGAIGIEVVSATAGAEVEALTRDENDPLVWTLACFEESLELSGLVVMTIAVMQHLRDHALRGRRIALRLR